MVLELTMEMEMVEIKMDLSILTRLQIIHKDRTIGGLQAKGNNQWKLRSQKTLIFKKSLTHIWSFTQRVLRTNLPVETSIWGIIPLNNSGMPNSSKETSMFCCRNVTITLCLLFAISINRFKELARMIQATFPAQTNALPQR